MEDYLSIGGKKKNNFPGGTSGKESACQRRRRKRCGFTSWVGKIPWRRKWQPTPVFFPIKSHGLYYPAIRKNEILPFASTWMDLEGIMLGEINQTEKDKYHIVLFIW